MCVFKIKSLWKEQLFYLNNRSSKGRQINYFILNKNILNVTNLIILFIYKI